MSRHLMKIVISIMIIFIFAMVLVSCGGQTTTEPTPTPTQSSAPSTSPPIVSPTPGADSTDLRAKGEEIYQKTAGGIGCQSCHGADGKGKPNTAQDIRGETADDIIRALNGDAMSFIYLTEDEIEAVAVYLKYLESQP